MADYTLHLGFNWNSPTIGSIWSSEGTDDRFLQYALADAGGAPAWFQFQPDDNLYVRAWDLSSSMTPIPSAWVLNMSLGPLDAGATETYDPSAYLSLNGNASVETSDGSTNSYLQLSSVAFSYDPGRPYTSPWGPCRGQSSLLGPLTFITASSFKLSFYLSASAVLNGERATHVFISDPEVIVGSRG